MSILEAGRNITRQILGSSGVSTPKNLESLFESDNESGYDADGAHSSGTSRMRYAHGMESHCCACVMF
jgi:hypothetical protein